MTRAAGSQRWRDTWLVAGLGLLLRLLLVAWAAQRFPPAADGSYYHIVASRIAEGHGSTWLWPDGAVSYAAHYPIGLPALMAGGYALFGPQPAWVMLLNALFGAAMVAAVHRLLMPARRRRLALIGALLVAVHPGLVMYTAAVMTEGITAALLTLAAWVTQLARRRRGRLLRLVGLGVILGVATLIRPQSVLLAPLLGALAAPRGWRARVGTAAGVTLLSLLICLPWTARNCVRMERCALVSVNGGWNLLIGTQPEGRGGWSELVTPNECREVFHEAHKDSCFERAAVAKIRAQPLAWLQLVPAKLGVTFDYCGAPGWYLHESNAAAFGDRAKWWLGAAELLFERVMLLLALLAAAPRLRRAWSRQGGARTWLQLAASVLGLMACFSRHGWLAVLLLMVALALGRPLRRRSVLWGANLAVLLTTFAVHAVFFGAGRYQLVVLPFVTALAALGAGRVCGWRRSGVSLRAWFSAAAVGPGPR